MKDFQSYRQKKNNEYAEQKPMRLELRNGKETGGWIKCRVKDYHLGMRISSRWFVVTC